MLCKEGGEIQSPKVINGRNPFMQYSQNDKNSTNENDTKQQEVEK